MAWMRVNKCSSSQGVLSGIVTASRSEQVIYPLATSRLCKVGPVPRSPPDGKNQIVKSIVRFKKHSLLREGKAYLPSAANTSAIGHMNWVSIPGFN